MPRTFLIMTNIRDMRQLIDHIPVPVAMLDRNMNYLGYSRAWLEMYKLNEEILGKNHYDIFPQIPDVWKKIHQEVLNSGVMQKNDCDYFTLEDNSEVYLKWVVSPWFLENGDVGGLHFLTQDITTEEIAKKRMARSHKVAKLGWWEFDLKTQKISWSKGMFEIFPENVEDGAPGLERHRSTIHPDDREYWEETYMKAVREEIPYTMIFRVLCPGEVKWVEAKGSPRKNVKGEVVAIYGTAQDVSEREEKRILLERKNDEMKIFSYRASHDLKAPLTSMEGLISLLKEDIEEGNKKNIDESLQDIQSLISNLKETISDVLKVSMIEDLKSKPQILSLITISEDLKVKLGGYMTSEKVNFQYDCYPNKETQITIPSSKLYNVLENLISNSIKYAHPERESFVKLTLEVKDKNLLIEVRDNGLGFPKDNREKIFSMFHRFHTVAEGTGLGLYMVKRQIDDWHGNITFESSPDGTHFKISIPLSFQ